MRTAKLATLLVLAAPFSSARGQAPDKIDSLAIPPAEYVFERPKQFTFIRNFPGDVRDYGRVTFRKKNALKIFEMAAGTAVLVVADQDITDKAYWLGDRLDLSHSSHQKTYANFGFSVGGKRLALPIGGPDNISNAMYFLGDGITHFSIAGSFWVYGLAKKDNRARQTATQLTESIISTGFAIQLLKHLSGRESPFVATVRGGRWDLFPDQVEYAKHTPHYDAFPSGHLATAMATVTVIAENYPEHRYIRPVGYSLMTVLGYAMLNNKVHWASDYPLALTLGDTFAKIAVRKGRKPVKSSGEPSASEEKTSSGSARFQMTPMFTGRSLGLGARVQF